MLTKNDLEQIRGVVREEVKSEVSSQIHGVKADINGIKADISTVKKDVASFRTEVGTQIAGVKADVKTQIEGVKVYVKNQVIASEKRMSRKLRKMQNSILQYHDEYAIYLRERIEKLEERT